MIENATSATFSPHLGEKFRVRIPSGAPLELELIVVTPAGPAAMQAAAAQGRRAPFSIVFRGPARPFLPQRIYPLEHAALGRFEVFLVPIAPDADGCCYEAVFN